MGYKIKQLGPAFRGFTANLPSINLTAGVPIAELFFGLFAQIVKTAQGGDDGLNVLNQIDEIRITRGGQSIVEIENGLDLWALTKAPWNAQAPDVTTGGSSGHYTYWKGLCLPLSLPPGAAGEFVLQVANAGTANTDGETISITEGWGRYAANYLSHEAQMLNTQADNGKHFHIVKRLNATIGTGDQANWYIGTEGDLIGLLIWSETEQDELQAKDTLGITKLRLDIGGESVIETSSLTAHGTQGPTFGSQSFTTYSYPTAPLGEFMYFDFRSQPWDCRGKSVNLRITSGVTSDDMRAYPIYLVDW